MTQRYAVLLRGINVGGRNSLAMKDLAAMLADLGCVDVKTYIQSGNAVFGASKAVAAKLPEKLSARIEQDTGMKVPVAIRSAAELLEISTSNPFLKAGAEETACYVGFLTGTPTKAAIAKLDPDRSPPDRFEVVGTEI